MSSRPTQTYDPDDYRGLTRSATEPETGSDEAWAERQRTRELPLPNIPGVDVYIGNPETGTWDPPSADGGRAGGEEGALAGTPASDPPAPIVPKKPLPYRYDPVTETVEWIQEEDYR